MIVVTSNRDVARIVAMLALALAGLAAMFHCARLRPAARLGLVPSDTIRRYLRLHA